jgi:hypothetical protein
MVVAEVVRARTTEPIMVEVRGTPVQPALPQRDALDERVRDHERHNRLQA